MLNRLVLLLVGLLIVLRFWDLTGNPAGFMPDEASVVYNAFSVLETGKDEHGVLLPVYFKAFGEYKNPIFIYSVIPIIKLFESSVFAGRITAALWVGLAVGLLWLIIKLYQASYQISLLALLLSLTSPWLFHLGRLALEVATVPAAYLCFLYANYQMLQSAHKKRFLVLIILSSALVFYSYSATRILAIGNLIVSLWLLKPILTTRQRIGALIGFILLLLPALFWEVNYPGSITARYQQISIWSFSQELPIYQQVVGQYINHFNPAFWAWDTSFSGIHINGGSAPFGLLSIPLIILGIISLLKSRTPINKLVLFCLLSAPIPASLVVNTPNNIRSTPFLTVLLLVQVLGLLSLSRLGLNQPFKLVQVKITAKLKVPVWRHKLMLLGLLLILAEVGQFQYRYWTSYNVSVSGMYTPLEFEAVKLATKFDGPVYINNQQHPANYISYLLLANYPPRKYQLSGLEEIDIVAITAIPKAGLGSYVLFNQECNPIPPVLSQARLVYSNARACVYRVN